MLDPDLCLREAKRGFHGASISLTWHGTPAVLTEQVFELADEPERPIPQELTHAVACATLIRCLSPAECLRLQQRADAGDAASEAVYHAYVIGQLCHMRRAAKRLMHAALSGNEGAKQSVEGVFAAALHPDCPYQKRAEICAYLLRDVLAEHRREEINRSGEVEAPKCDHPADAVCEHCVEKVPVTVAMSGCPTGHPSDLQCDVCAKQQASV